MIFKPLSLFGILRRAIVSEGTFRDGRLCRRAGYSLYQGCPHVDRAAPVMCQPFSQLEPDQQAVRISAFSPFLYRYRSLVENFFSELKHFRAEATRYDKRDDNFLASVQLASIRIWLRHNESVT